MVSIGIVRLKGFSPMQRVKKVKKKLMTQKEVDALPEGSEVEITWSGGNGPHIYKVIKDKWGYSCVDTCYKDKINFVGESPLTEVMLLKLGRKPKPCRG